MELLSYICGGGHANGHEAADSLPGAEPRCRTQCDIAGALRRCAAEDPLGSLQRQRRRGQQMTGEPLL
eukprot:6788565-Prorocentrum_lima.AAC.1